MTIGVISVLGQSHPKGLDNINRTFTWTMISSFVCIFLISVLAKSKLGQELNDRIGMTFDFRMRDWLGKSPELDKRIKIFGFDDKTIGSLGRPELYIEEWSLGLKHLSRDKPNVIIIDKMFSIIYDPNLKSAQALAALSELETNFVVGSFATPQAITYRNEMGLDSNLYDLSFVKKNGVHLKPYLKDLYLQKPSLGKIETDSPPTYPGFKDFRKMKIYGPAKEFIATGSYVGHLQYGGHTKVAPMIRVGEHSAIPHASLFAAESIKMDQKRLLINDIEVPIDSAGEVVVNLAPPQTYYKGQKRLGLILDKSRTKPLVNEGDIVLLLPNIYTGGTDFHLTPFGYAPGGFIIAAMINSALTNKWLKSIRYPRGLIAAASILGGILGATASSLGFWLLLTSGVLGIVVAATASFSYFSLIVPWLWLGLAFLINGLLVFAEKARYTEKRAQRLQLVEAERKLLEKEIQEASIMAEAYRPDQLPTWKNLVIAGYHQPIHAASGDWFAFENSKDQKLCHMIMCDITGHGVQAALVVSACKTLMGNIQSMRPELLESENFIADYMHLLNGILWKQGHGQHVTTLLGLTFDLESSMVHFLAAGHPYPLLRRSSKLSERPASLLSRHNPLGMDPKIEPVIKSTRWEIGDEILAFTDGLPLLENRRILKKVKALDEKNLEQSARDLYTDVWALETAKSGKSIDDDVSIVWFKKVS